MKERALVFGRDQLLIGVLTERDAACFSGDNKTAVLLLSSGLDHHVGPNRIYVKISRMLAENGIFTFRFSFSGIGDSGPRRDKLPAAESVIDETKQAMDHLENLCGVSRYCCIGLCLGANVAAEALKADQRVKTAILINPILSGTVQGVFEEQLIVYRKHAFSNLDSWVRLLTLRSDYQRLWRTIWARLNKRYKSPVSVREGDYDNEKQIREYFQSIQSRDVRILMIFSHAEFGDVYLERVLRKEYQSLINSGVLKIVRIKNADHSMTSLASQNELIDVISDFLNQRP